MAELSCQKQQNNAMLFGMPVNLSVKIAAFVDNVEMRIKNRNATAETQAHQLHHNTQRGHKYTTNRIFNQFRK